MRRIQVEVERPDGTLKVIGEFTKSGNDPTDAPEISRETARKLEQCFEKFTAYEKIQFLEEYLPIPTPGQLTSIRHPRPR